MSEVSLLVLVPSVVRDELCDVSLLDIEGLVLDPVGRGVCDWISVVTLTLVSVVFCVTVTDGGGGGNGGGGGGGVVGKVSEHPPSSMSMGSPVS